MNIEERINCIRAMETIARCINDETVFEKWLILGVADGDIDESTTDDELEYYCKDEIFAELMQVFLSCMKAAESSGGLYCDHIVSHWETQ